MRLSKRVGARLLLGLVIAGSTLIITCATRSSIPNETVQLSQIRNVEARFDRILDVAIRTQLAGGRSAIVADEFATSNETGEVDESGRNRVFGKRLKYWRVTGEELTVNELQRLRTALHFRVDEAYATRGDLARFSDLTSLTVSRDGITGSLNLPANLSGTGR